MSNIEHRGEIQDDPLKDVPENVQKLIMEAMQESLAGSSDKDRRYGPDAMRVKKLLQAYSINLGQCVALEKKLGIEQSNSITKQLTDIFRE